MQQLACVSKQKTYGLAGNVAESHGIPPDKAKPILDVHEHVHLIQNISTVVTKYFPQRPHNANRLPKTNSHRSHELQNTIELASHHITMHQHAALCH